MDDKTYHAYDAMSQSKLKILMDDPREYYNRYVLKQYVDTPTPSKQLGTCLDLALTDPIAYSMLIVKDCKATTAENCITKNWQKSINSWMEKLNNYPMALPEFKRPNGAYFKLGEIFSRCKTQTKMFWTDPETQERCRGKMDYDFYHKTNSFLIDLKSTKATTQAEFERDFIKYKYYLQAAMYCTGYMIEHKLDYYPPFYFVAVSTKTGRIFVIKVSDQMLEMGLKLMNTLLLMYQQFRLTGEWAIDDAPVIMDIDKGEVDKINRLYAKYNTNKLFPK